MSVSKKTSKSESAMRLPSTSSVVTGSTGCSMVSWLGCIPKRLVPRVLVGVLLPLVHLLLELLCFLLVHKRQSGHAVLQLEAVKERPVLVVLECIVDFLVP